MMDFGNITTKDYVWGSKPNDVLPFSDENTFCLALQQMGQQEKFGL